MPARILIIEDEPLIQESLRGQLAALGYESRTASSAEGGLLTLEQERFEALLMDNILPGMTGMKALAEVRRRSAAPVLFMTGHFDPETRTDALLLGAAGVLAKPFSTPELAAALAKVLAKP
jgi:DNA-binding response OmpR family regulator